MLTPMFATLAMFNMSIHHDAFKEETEQHL